MIGLVGTKIGMTRIFTKSGESIPVSVIKIEDNYITQIKNFLTDGYTAIQVTTGRLKTSKVNKPQAGHFKKAGVIAGRTLKEFRISKLEENNLKFTLGESINVNFFSNFPKVDITGISKGKGFAGTVKRWNFHTQDATHGNSLSHRVPGSIGQNQTPGRVFKGKKMAGRLGNERITIQNLKVIRVDTESNYLLVKGSIPGFTGSEIIIKPAIKSSSSGDKNGITNKRYE
ncbi:MAG: 50S ribosomal protein L3 [Candidatus Dasytiphilus stammeri]